MNKSKMSSLTVKMLEKLWYEKVQPPMWELFFDVRVFSFPGMKHVIAQLEHVFKLSRVPFIQDRFSWIDPQKNTFSWLPINRDIEGAGSIALPEEVLGRLIDKASHRVILDVCLCRQANVCSHYSIDTGCLFMGESTLKFPRKISLRVSGSTMNG